MFNWLRRLFDRDALEGRSPEWRAVRNEFIRLHPVCEVCGGDDDLEAHHVRPFHLHPELELDPQNLIALCRPHHYLVGHLMDWRSFNLTCEHDAKEWRKKILARP